MTIDNLRTEMLAGFEGIDERFAEVDERFVRIDERFTRIDERITAEGIAIRRYIDERITAEGETTRRHFDVVAEDLRDMIRIIAEGTPHDTQRLDDHETRLTRLEKRRE
jgi:hypothetical protein